MQFQIDMDVQALALLGCYGAHLLAGPVAQRKVRIYVYE
jgi:hypothetical protein